MKNRLYLWNRVFLLALFGLLFNDFYLKSAYPSFISGKLSDFCGLIVFVLFFVFLLGERFLVPIIVLTALLFCWWKSPWSNAFIDSWNSTLNFFPIQRTLDLTDLWCILAFIPLAFYDFNSPKKHTAPKWVLAPLICLSLFAIVATSKAKPVTAYDDSRTYFIGKTFKLKMTSSQFLENLSYTNISFEKNPDTAPTKPADYHWYLLKNFTINNISIESMTLGLKNKNNQILVYISKEYFLLEH
jgi:hypothetical protein